MGVWKSLVVTVLFMVTSNAQVTCPYRGAYIPHPTNCKAYYTCNYQPVYQECGDMLVFNPAYKVCDWPANVPGCEGYYTTNNNNNNEGCPGTGIEYHADPDDCYRYFKCENGVKYHLRCGLSFAWDDSIKGCNNPAEVASCNTEASTQRPGEPIPGYVNCSISTYHGDLSNCQKYYRCEGSNVYHLECPSGFIYDLANENCGDPKNIALSWLYCNNATTTTSTSTTTSTTTTVAPTTEAERVTVCYQATTPAPVCSATPPILGQPVTMVTPETICVTVSSPVKRQVEEFIPDFECPRNGRFPDEEGEGTTYISCLNGKPMRNLCRHEKVFNPKLGRCSRIVMNEGTDQATDQRVAQFTV
ncbi:uncharacterized protein LOC135461875 [Liolophura sinensis]|uniref:uncharacterized protein LOC135461875 n=1 Tax=Liolophura sinensis TaxID=3198878 RepID=UPI0031592B42